MDPLTILGLSYAGKEVVSVVGQFTREIFGPSAQAVGKGLAAPLQAWAEDRARRAETLVIDAAVLLEEADGTPQPVPGRILWPLLEAGSLEEDAELRSRWVALLANAADSTGGAIDILPAYVEILKQLTPLQARMLAWIDSRKTETRPKRYIWRDVSRDTLEQQFQLSHGDYALLITDLDRLKLIEHTTKPERLSLNRNNADHVLERLILRLDARVDYQRVSITALGIAFMSACSRPASSRLT